MQNVSETLVYHCPINGITCIENTRRLRKYAAWLENLAKTKSPLLFHNGGICWCPGACGDSIRKEANERICKECGIDPVQHLDVNGIPYVHGRQR